MIRLISFVSFLLAAGAFAESPDSVAPSSENKVPAKVHYKAGKEIDFENLLINGQLRRPEISVVTGDTQKGSDGLLRLRENFLDRISMDAGEDVQ